MNIDKYIIKFQTYLFLFTFLIIISYISANKTVLPFTTKTNPFDPNDEFKFIFKNEIFVNLEIGSPIQNIELYLTMRTPFFIIKRNDTFPQYYKNTSSSTYKHYDNTSTYYFNDDVLQRGIYSAEKINIQTSFNGNDKIAIKDLDFVYATEYQEDSKRHAGILGLQFLTTNNYVKEVNYINTLKRNRLISSYVWHLNYTSENSGYIVIGEYPHTYDPKNYDKDNLLQVNVRQVGAQKIVWNLYFDNIQYGETTLNEHRTANFAPQYGTIFGPQIFHKLIKTEFFDEYINQKKCEEKTYNDKHDYFVCDEDISLDNFKDIVFTEKALENKNFTLTKDDLFMKKNGKLYFLVSFGQNWKWQYSWVFGKPFMKKYTFFFDQDNKQLLIYKDKVEENGSSKNYIFILWIGIGVLLIIIGFLVYYLIKLYKERKKKLYELEDDFDYMENSDKNNENNNENKGNKIIKFDGENEGDGEDNKIGIN